MSDYYKNNILGLPRFEICTHEFQILKPRGVIKQYTIYDFIKFYTHIKNCLTKTNQINYVLIRSIPSCDLISNTLQTLNLIRKNLITFMNKIFNCSVNVLLGFKNNLVRNK